MQSFQKLIRLQQPLFSKNLQKYNFYATPKPKEDFNIVLIGSKNHSLFSIFKNQFNDQILDNPKFDDNVKKNPVYHFVENFEEFESKYKKEDGSMQKIDMVSLVEFGKDQTDLLLKIYEQQPENIQIIHGFLVGVDKFLPIIKDKVDQKRVIVTNAKGSFSPSLAEFVAFSCLYHAKKAPFFNKMQYQKKWIREPVDMISNKTLSIIGFGDIGLTVGKYCKKLGIKIIAVKNNLTNISQEQKDTAEEIHSMKELKEVLQKSDYVVNTLPLTSETNELFDLKKFKWMKKSAHFINIGRGQTVNETDLARAVHQKIIAGASLDVFQVEPLPECSELWELEEVYISQHCADVTNDYWELTFNTFAENLILHLKDQPMKNIVDYKKGY